MELLPITHLSPEIAPPHTRSIRAIVTLSWPYSSSTRQCALLLADPDFRLRNRQGQVRVRFTGASAEAVAKSRIGIGDEVVLALEGASWEQDPEASRTPGKSIDGELVYKRKLQLKVKRGEEDAEVSVDAPVSPPKSPETEDVVATPLPRAVSNLRSSLDGTTEALPSYTYTSPAFVKRLRLSGESFLDSAYDPFAADDASFDEDGKKQRISFGTNLRWRYAEKTPSPQKVRFEASAEETEVMDGVPESPTRLKATMAPPPLPKLQVPVMEASVDLEDDRPSTPKLQPVKSPTLPLPSPFPTDKAQLPFAPTGAGVLYSIGGLVSQQQHVGVPPTLEDEAEREEDEDMLNQLVKFDEQAKQPQLPENESEDELYESSVGHPEPDPVILEDEHSLREDVVGSMDDDIQTEVVKDSERSFDNIRVLSSPVIEETMDVGPNELEVSAQLMSSPYAEPRTPRKQTQNSRPLPAFGLDGAGSAPPSAQVTPQSSEKERIMAKTFSSLFGFKTVVESAPPVLAEKLKQASLESSVPSIVESEMTRERLDVAGMAPITPKPSAEQLKKQIPVIKDETADSLTFKEQFAPAPQHQSPATSSAPPRPSQVTVIDLDSSSDEEDVAASEKSMEQANEASVQPESPQQKAAPTPPPAFLRRQSLRLEVQDSLADSDGEDLLGSKRTSPQEPSGLRTMVEQDSQVSQQAEVDDFSRLDDRHAVSEKSTLPVKRRQFEEPPTSPLSSPPLEVLTPTQIERTTRPPPSGEHVAVSSPPSSVPAEIEASPKRPESASHSAVQSPYNDLSPHDHEEFENAVMAKSATTSPRVSMHSEVSVTQDSPVAKQISAGSPSLPVAASSFRARPTPEHHEPDARTTTPPPKSTAPTTVIELGSSSTIERTTPSPIKKSSQDKELLESFIEPEKLESPTSIRSADTASIQSEPEVIPDAMSPTPEPRILQQDQVKEIEAAQSLGFETQLSHQPSYPSLPLSPSNSQSLQDMPSQAIAESMLQDTVRSIFPPTPQLTQRESTLVEDREDMDVETSQQQPDGILSDPQAQAEVKVQPIQQGVEQAIVEASTSNQLQVEASSQVEPAHDEHLPIPQKKPSRKSLSTRLSNVPDVISAWFSPKRSSGVALDDSRKDFDAGDDEVETQHVNGTEQTVMNGHVEEHNLQQSDLNGVSTALSYYTPLARLPELLNPSSQQVFGNSSTVDVFAVVTDKTKEPERAKAGPRDYFTLFRVTDASMSSQNSVRVEVFRPWMATLPVANTGDVVLLRAFAVKSRKRMPYLLSTDASAWCIWRHDSQETANRPIWARKGSWQGGGVREEIKGPPVELGNEEREHAERLRQWWLASQVDIHVRDAGDQPGGSDVNGYASQSVAARL